MGGLGVKYARESPNKFYAASHLVLVTNMVTNMVTNIKYMRESNPIFTLVLVVCKDSIHRNPMQQFAPHIGKL